VYVFQPTFSSYSRAPWCSREVSAAFSSAKSFLIIHQRPLAPTIPLPLFLFLHPCVQQSQQLPLTHHPLPEHRSGKCSHKDHADADADAEGDVSEALDLFSTPVGRVADYRPHLGGRRRS
jgi:hypothetical protein